MRNLMIVSAFILVVLSVASLGFAGPMMGDAAKTQFSGWVSTYGGTYLSFDELSEGTQLDNQYGSKGVRFKSIRDPGGSSISKPVVIKSFGGSMEISGEPSWGTGSDGRVAFEIRFDQPQRWAGIARHWDNFYTITNFYNPSGVLIHSFQGIQQAPGWNRTFLGFWVESDDTAQWISRIECDGTTDSTGTQQVGYSDDLYFGTASPCSYTISPTSNSFGPQGGSGSISVTAGAGCAWTASVDSGSAAWVSIASGASGTGNGTINYSVQTNSTSSPRTGTITVAGKTFTITQQAAPACTYSISPASNSFTPQGGSGSVSVTAGAGCAWTASVGSGSTAWISITSGASGTGNGAVNYSVQANSTNSARTGTLTIAGQTFTVTQTGTTPAGPPKISVSATSINFGSLSTGSTSQKTVTIKNSGKSDLLITSMTVSGNNASDFSEADQCTNTPMPAGGSGTITLTFAPASGGKKSATLSVASNDPRKPTVKVKLSGSAKASPCTYSLTSSSQQCGRGGGTWTVGVNALSGCNWTATVSNSAASWITITSGASGSGNGTVTYTVAANSSISSRTGTMTIAGQTFTVTQASGAVPVYTPSAFQQALLDKYGAPDYLSIAFGSTAPMRQETWVYVKLQKMYLFWDGVSLGATTLTLDPNAYANPPYVDPRVFTKDTTLSDLASQLQSNSTVVDQSALKDVIGNANFQTYGFKEAGVFVAFLDGSLADVQTMDIPEGTGGSSLAIPLVPKNEISSFAPRRILETQVQSQESKSLPFPYGVGGVEIFAVSWYFGAQYLATLIHNNPQFMQDCQNIFSITDPGKQEACQTQMENMIDEAAHFGLSLFWYLLLPLLTTQDDVADRCGGGAPFPPSDEFPYCPGTTTPCTSYTYGPWGACSSDSTSPTGHAQTRTATPSPQGCTPDTGNTGVPEEPLTSPCTPLATCTDYNYASWGPCSPDPSSSTGYSETRSYQGYLPPGCTGTPSNPPVLNQPCTPPCTGYDVGSWGACVADSSSPTGYSETRTVTPSPPGCTGTPPGSPPATTQSCNPCPSNFPVLCPSGCYIPGAVCCPVAGAYIPGVNQCCFGGPGVCNVGYVCTTVGTCCLAATPYPCPGTSLCAATPQQCP